MQYVFVAYINNLNAILVRAMPSKNDGVMIDAFIDILAALNTCGYAPTLNVTENSQWLPKPASQATPLASTLSPPTNHQVNTDKHMIVIATFKEHFISDLATIDKDCPLQLWDDFLPQVELTLNLLQFSQRDTTKSGNEEVNGKFDYNKTLLAPLCTKGLVYKDPAVQARWVPHGTAAYYIGPALNHYWCL